MSKKSKKSDDSTIAVNRKASFDYHLHEIFEAGMVLEGWEVKSLRMGRCQIAQSYVILKNGEAWLLGSQVTPLNTTSTHMRADAIRTRKLLLHKKELRKLAGSVERKGYTLIPLKLYWKDNKIKLSLAVAEGKKQYDKRHALKERDWAKDKRRLVKLTQGRPS